MSDDSSVYLFLSCSALFMLIVPNSLLAVANNCCQYAFMVMLTCKSYSASVCVCVWSYELEKKLSGEGEDDGY